MDCSPRLALPFLSPGQAQKELLHNEALQRLDALVAAAVEEPPRISPPDEPSPGACYIVGNDATGEWLGKDGSLAAYSSGGWRFIDAPEGTVAFVRSAGVWAARTAGGWEVGQTHCAAVLVGGEQVLGPRSAPIASPAGGKRVDDEARRAIGEMLIALRGHGLIGM